MRAVLGQKRQPATRYEAGRAWCAPDRVALMGGCYPWGMGTQQRLRDQRHRLRRRLSAVTREMRRARDDVHRTLTALGLPLPTSNDHDVIELAVDGSRPRSPSAAVRVIRRGAWIGVGVVVLGVVLWSIGVVSAAFLLAVFVFRQLGLRVDLSRAASPT